MNQQIDWPDFMHMAWEKSPYGAFCFRNSQLQITVIKLRRSSKVQLFVHANSTETKSILPVRFTLPISIRSYNELIKRIEKRHSVLLPELKWAFWGK